MRMVKGPGGAGAALLDRERKEKKDRKGRSPFDEALGAMAGGPQPLQIAAREPAVRVAPAPATAPPRAHASRAAPAPIIASRDRAPETGVPPSWQVPRAELIPALAPPPATRVPEAAAPPVHVPRAALEDPAFLVSIRPGSATIRVQPSPDAAAVTLRVGIRQGVATIRADGAAGAQLLTDHQRELEAALERHGLRLGAVETTPTPSTPPPRRRRSRS